MSQATSICNDLGFYPDHYEGSYLDIFTSINFNILFPDQPARGDGTGRPPFPRGALFGVLVLKALMPSGTFRRVESKLEKDTVLAMALGFDGFHIPSDSMMRQFLSGTSTEFLYHVMRTLLEELHRHGLACGRVVSLDSTPVDAHNRPPTKKKPVPGDPDAAWGKAKCKGGYYYGYKAQVLVDAEDGLPLYPIVTPANVSDMKMVEPFIEPLKEWGFSPEYLVADKGYDSGHNHLVIREDLGSYGLIAVNKRRGKKKYGFKVIKKYEKLTTQKTLDEFIPVKKRAREYRECCIIYLKRGRWKWIMRRRALSEGAFSRMKGPLELEKIKVTGLENVTKHVLFKCIAMLVIALAAVRMGVDEAFRSARYFQN